MIKRIRPTIELLDPVSLKTFSAKLQHLVTSRLWLRVILAMFAGVFVGLILNPSLGFFEKDFSFMVGEWLALPGTIFLSVIQMVVLPLIFASVITGIASSEDSESLKKNGLFVGAFFVVTTLFAVLLGLFLAHVIQPGSFIPLPQTNDIDVVPVEEISFNMQTIPSLITQVIPTNIFSAFLNLQFFQIVLFSIIIGVALVNIDVKQSKPLIELLGSIQNVCITIVQWAMLLVPLAVFGFMARATIQLGLEVLFGMSFYVFTVLLGLLILLVLNAVIVFIFTGLNPKTFFSNIKDVLLLAFSTSSSATVMPLSMRVTEEKFFVKKSIANFVIPMGTTMNMNGTALYQSVAIIFLAQVFGINLSLPVLLMVILAVVASSIGAPGTPGASIVILSTIMSSIGIPLFGISLILGFDRILDMFRTAINVTGDISAAIILNKISE